MQRFGLALLTTVMLAPLAVPTVALAQRLVEVTPELGSNAAANTSISGRFDTTGGTVDPQSVQIFVNDRDVTDRSTISRDFFTYRPDQPFPPGQVPVRVDYRNTNGDRRSTTWTFNVQAQNALRLDAVTHNAVTPLATGSTFRVTLNGTPGAQATVLLVQDRQTVRSFPARETSSGVYVANLQVEQGDRSRESVVVGRLEQQGQVVFAAAAQPAVFNVGSSNREPNSPQLPSRADLQPRFTNHQDGDRVGSKGFTLEGQTRPGASVQINVMAGASVLGVNVGGQTLVDRTVTADRNGNFRVDVPAPALGVPGLQYKVRATASDGGQTSPPTEITLK